MHTQNIQPSQPGTNGALVSIGLPVRNGARTVAGVVASVLTQDHEHLELIICDNASTDDTEAVCRELASRDDRIVYYRQSANVGVLRNFNQALHLAKGTFVRWVGDDDWLAPSYISRCLEVFASDSRLILVTTQVDYVEPDGNTHTYAYSDQSFYSDDPIQRFERLLFYIGRESVPVDPLYGLARRANLAAIVRKNVIREDQLFATRLALAGPWGHVPEILAKRNLKNHGASELARYLGVPVWQAYVPTAVQCWEILRALRTERLTPAQWSRAQVAIGRLFVSRHYRTFIRRARRVFPSHETA